MNYDTPPLFRELTRRRLASFATGKPHSPTTSARSERRESNARILERLKRKKHELLRTTPGDQPLVIVAGESNSRSISPQTPVRSRQILDYEEQYWNAMASLRKCSGDKTELQRLLNIQIQARQALEAQLNQMEQHQVAEKLNWERKLQHSRTERENYAGALLDLEKDLKEREHSLEMQKKERHHWEQRASALEAAGAEMEKNNEALQEQVLKMEKELDQDFIRVSEELLTKSSDLSDFNSCLSQASSGSTFWLTVKKGLDNLLLEEEERTLALSEENSKLRSERESIMADKIRLEKLALQHDDEMHALNQKIDEQKLAVQEIDEMRIQLDSAREGELGQKLKLEEANASIDKMLAEIHSLQDRLRSQTDQKEELEEALKRAISEKSESEIQITADYERLQSQINEHENIRKRFEDLQVDHSNLKQNHIRLQENLKSMQENHTIALTFKDEQIASIGNQLQTGMLNWLQANPYFSREKWIAREEEEEEVSEQSTSSASSIVCADGMNPEQQALQQNHPLVLKDSDRVTKNSTKYDADDVKEESPLRCNDPEAKPFTVSSLASLTVDPKLDSHAFGIYHEQMKYYQDRLHSQEDHIERLLGYIDNQQETSIMQDPQILLKMKHEVEICNQQIRTIKLDTQQKFQQFLLWLNRSMAKCSHEISDLTAINKQLQDENNALVTDTAVLLEHFEILENTNAELHERYEESQTELNNMELFFGELKRAYPEDLLKTLQEEILHASGLLSSTSECFNIYKQNDETILNSKSNEKCVSCALSLATTLNRYRTLSEIRKVQYTKVKEEFRKYRSKMRKNSSSTKEVIVQESLEDLLNNVMSREVMLTKDKQIEKLHSIVQDQTKVIQDKDSMLMTLHEEMIQQSPSKVALKSEECDAESVYKRFEKAEKHYIDESTRIQDYWDQLMKAIFDRVHTLEAEVSRLQSKVQEDGENDLKIRKLEEEIRLLDSTSRPLPKSNMFMTRVVERHDLKEEGELAALRGRIFLLEKEAVEEAFIRDELRSLLAAKTEPPPLKLESLPGVEVEVTCDWEKVAAQMEFEKAVMREEIETLSSALSARRSFQDYEELCKNEYQVELQKSIAVLPEQNWPKLVEDLETRLDEVMAQVRHHEQYQAKLEKVVGTLSRQQATCSEHIPTVVAHFEETCAYCQEQWESRCTLMMSRITDLNKKCQKLHYHSMRYRSAHYRRHMHAEIKRFQIYVYAKNQRAKVEHILTKHKFQYQQEQLKLRKKMQSIDMERQEFREVRLENENMKKELEIFALGQKQEQAEFERKYEVLMSQFVEVQDRLQEAMQAETDAQAESLDIQQELDDCVSKLAEYESDNLKMRNQISELTISDVSNRDNTRKLEAKLREQLEEVIKLNEKLQTKQAQIEALHTEMAKEVQEKDGLIRERESLLEERENIGGLMKEVEERNRRAETEKSLLHLQQESKQKQYVEEIQRLEGLVQIQNEQVSSLQREIEGKLEQMEELQAQIRERDIKLNHTNCTIETRDSELNQIKDQHEEEIRILQEDIQSKETKLRQITLKLNELKMDRDHYQKEVNREKLSYQKLYHEHLELQTRFHVATTPLNQQSFISNRSVSPRSTSTYRSLPPLYPSNV